MSSFRAFADSESPKSPICSRNLEAVHNQVVKRQTSSSHAYVQKTNISQMAAVATALECAMNVKSLSS